NVDVRNPKALAQYTIDNELPFGDYQIHGFMDIDHNADPNNPGPDTGDPVMIPIGGYKLSCGVQPVDVQFAITLLAGCTPAVVSTSSTIAVLNNTVLVTSSDDDALVELDATTLRESKRVATPKGPEHVLVVDGFAWVTASLDTKIARFKLADFSGALTIDVPCGGTSDIARDEARKRVAIE